MPRELSRCRRGSRGCSPSGTSGFGSAAVPGRRTGVQRCGGGVLVWAAVGLLSAATTLRAAEEVADDVAAAAGAAELSAAPEAARGVEIRFVPATVGGTVSLGIYNEAGELVRVLCDEWTFSRFRVGLNGLSTTWDGRGDDGQPVAPGTYTARGYVVGDVQLSGEAFHFNDWIESPDSPRLVRVASAQLLPGGDVLLTARLVGATGALVRYSPESEARWRTVVAAPRPVPAVRAALAVSETMAFVLLDGELQAASLEDGTEVSLPRNTSGVKAVAARGQQVAVLDGEGLSFHALPSFASQGDLRELPADLVSVALLEQGAVAADAGGKVWRWQAGWSLLDWPDEVRVRSVHGGRGGTFWALEERAEGALFVVQYCPEEGRLAEWTPHEPGARIASLAAATDRDYFVAVLDTTEGQRTVAIRRREGDTGWEFVFDKKTTECAEFGWRDGRLAARGGDTPTTMEIVLGENPLDADASRVLGLQAVADESGTGLATLEGLPLLRVSGEAGYQRVMLVAAPEPEAARFFQGDGASVEEYRIADLGRITSFDAGSIAMAAGGEEAPAPPVVEPVLEGDDVTVIEIDPAD